MTILMTIIMMTIRHYSSDIPYLRELALNNNPLQKIEGHAFEMVSSGAIWAWSYLFNNHFKECLTKPKYNFSK